MRTTIDLPASLIRAAKARAAALFAALAPTLHLGGYRLAAKVRSGPTVLYVWEDAGRV